jgi:hypothetical protein
MDLSRRTLIAGAVASALIAPTHAQLFRGKGKTPAPLSGPYAPAADYAAARRGVWPVVM